MKDELLHAFNFRHACKLFDAGRQVAGDDLGFILEAGRLSPSSLGLEQWKFVVVRSQPLKDRLRAACMDQAQLSSCSLAVVILAKQAELAPDSDYVAAMLRRLCATEADYLALRAFYRQFMETTDVVAWSVAQCHIAAANMMTAAAAIGIDSCPIGAFDAAQVRSALGVDGQRYEIALILTFGYRVHPQPPRHRLPISELVEYR